MKKFIVVFLASLFVVWVLAGFFPRIARTAFTIPQFHLGNAFTFGGFNITYTIIFFVVCLFCFHKLASK